MILVENVAGTTTGEGITIGTGTGMIGGIEKLTIWVTYRFWGGCTDLELLGIRIVLTKILLYAFLQSFSSLKSIVMRFVISS